MLKIRKSFTLIKMCLFNIGFVAAQGNNLTAEQIIQRSINNAGGKRLDSVLGIETISRVITAGKDTISIAVKKVSGEFYFSSVISKPDSDTTSFFNKGRAAFLSGEEATTITDPLKLEELKLQTFLSIDDGYKKLGYRLERLEDQHFTNTDLYQVKVTSPLGNSTLNYYEKRTNNLTMILYPNGKRIIITDYRKLDGISYPSEIMMVDTLNNLTRSELKNIVINNLPDTNWFRLPETGNAGMPASMRSGNFVYVDGNEGSTIKRDTSKQVEANNDMNIEYKVKWHNANSYLLYDLKDPASLPVTANIKHIIVKVSSWAGKRYYCHFLTSGGDGGTCVFEKVD